MPLRTCSYILIENCGRISLLAAITCAPNITDVLDFIPAQNGLLVAKGEILSS